MNQATDLLRWQFDLTWALLEYHLERLEPADHLWEPAAHSWTLRADPRGSWVPDWADVEPDPIPVPTIAWLTWHIGWWWSSAVDCIQGRPLRPRAAVLWPGDSAAVAWLRGLRADWLATLDQLTDDDLDVVPANPWPGGADFTVRRTVAWVNAELMKNAAEIGQLRLLRIARE